MLKRVVWQVSNSRSFHTTTVARDKWTPEDDEKLIMLYEKHGPAWNVISKSLSRRTMEQCIFHYFARLNKIKSTDKLTVALHEKGYELYGEEWYEFHLEPFAKPFDVQLSKELIEWKHCGTRIRLEGFTEREKMVLHEAFNTVGPDWRSLNYRIKGRSEELVSRLFHRFKALFAENNLKQRKGYYEKLLKRDLTLKPIESENKIRASA